MSNPLCLPKIHRAVRRLANCLLAVALPPYLAAVAPLSAAPGPAGAIVKVTADDTSPGITIPSDFAGFSLETCGSVVVCSGWQPAGDDYLKPSNTPLINALRLVSPSCRLRIGGNSSDFVPAPVITAQAASELAAFLKAARCTLVYGLDAKVNDSGTAADQAGLIAAAVGAGNVTFQIGNEPSLISTYPAGQTNFQANLSDYDRLWLAYYKAIKAVVPGARFMGPDDTKTANLARFAEAVGASKLTDLTYHIYPLLAGDAGWSTTRNLLATPYSGKPQLPPPPPALTSSTVQAAAAHGLGARLTEFNSAFAGGRDGVSDALAAAAWVVDYGMTLGTAGWKSIHLHGRLAPADAAHPKLAVFYSPLTEASAGGGIAASPLYYGMMVLGRLAGGQVLPVTVVNGGPKDQAVVGYATKSASGGMTRIAAINRSTEKTASVVLDRTSAWTSGTALLLTGAGCDDTSTVTLGGAALDPAGHWAGTTVALARDVAVALPPCSTVLGVLR